MSTFKTMGQVRRERGIPESDYIKTVDNVRRIATIRCLARLLGPPDDRTEHPDSCQLHWSVERNATVVVLRDGAITS